MEEEINKAVSLLHVDGDSEPNALCFLVDHDQSSCATERKYDPLIRNEFAIQRLKQELQIIRKEPFTHCSCGPDGDDIFKWQAAIMGPPCSPMEDGIYFLSMDFPGDYPFSPPKIKLQTKVYHPSIDEDGNIYMDILEDRWSPAMTIMTLLISIWSVLADPTIVDPCGPLADLDSVERKNFDKKAREWTFKYAMGPSP